MFPVCPREENQLDRLDWTQLLRSPGNMIHSDSRDHASPQADANFAKNHIADDPTLTFQLLSEALYRRRAMVHERRYRALKGHPWRIVCESHISWWGERESDQNIHRSGTKLAPMRVVNTSRIFPQMTKTGQLNNADKEWTKGLWRNHENGLRHYGSQPVFFWVTTIEEMSKCCKFVDFVLNREMGQVCQEKGIPYETMRYCTIQAALHFTTLPYQCLCTIS